MEGHFFKVSFCGGISELKIYIAPELTYDDVINKCINHIKSRVCDPDSDASTNVAVYLPVFGLRLLQPNGSSENPVWLPYWHKFYKKQDVHVQGKQHAYEFRVRHRPVGFYKPDSIMGEYLFIQMVDDFMRDPAFPVGNNSVFSDDVFLLLLGISVLLQKKDLPLLNNEIVSLTWETPILRYRNILTFPQQLSASKAVCDRLTGGKFYNCEKKYWSFVSLRKNLKKMKEREEKLRFFKEKFHEFIVKCVPWYCTEVYQTKPSAYPLAVSAMMKLNQGKMDSGLYYGEVSEVFMLYQNTVNLLFVMISVLGFLFPLLWLPFTSSVRPIF
ncbi:hypothetical protein ElyMa_000693300 [Elysia marginata]|uniref:FERM domain-containing protein n=1 Tax=Elysia marginata TaxID=1093978 RepID=A0AAV4GHW4_9GAST|nr:hypothetical protein ElyMa_000693300 [Elysia marginata]